MKKISKLTLFIVMIISFSVFGTMTAFAEYYKFDINADKKCAVGDELKVTIELSSDEIINDSDAYFVFDTDYFEFVDSDSEEEDASDGKVRLRGDFSENSYSCTWSVTLKAVAEGDSEFSISDKWVQNGSKQVVSSESENHDISIGKAGETSSSNTSTEDLASFVYCDKSFRFNFTEPDSVPSCFSEDSANLCGSLCKVWKLNEGMSEHVNYTADASEFYAVYGYIDEEDESAWYLFDTKEESFQRLLMLQDVEVEPTEAPTEEAKSDNSEETKKESPAIISNVMNLIIIAFVVLVILIILVNVLFNKLEKNARRKRMEERRRASRDELAHKRYQERLAQDGSKKINRTAGNGADDLRERRDTDRR